MSALPSTASDSGESEPARARPLNAQSIERLVHGFYADVRKDPLLGPVFEQALHGRWDAHLQRLVDFWSTVALGTRSFRGDVFGRHMALQGVTPAHFAAWVGLWQRHTEQLLAPEVARELQVVAHGIARNLFRGYFGGEPAFAAPREGHSHSGASPDR